MEDTITSMREKEREGKRSDGRVEENRKEMNGGARQME